MQWVRKNLIWLVLFCLAVLLLLFKLNTLVDGLSKSELLLMTNNLGWAGILADALNLPMKVARSIIAISIGTDHVFINRMTSVFVGLLAFGLLVYVLRSWHDRKTTILTALLFVCSPLFLHVSRNVGYDVLQLLIIPTLFAGNILLRKYPESKTAFYAVVISWAALITIPGAVWFIMLNAWLKREDIIDSIRDLTGYLERTALLLVLILVFLPITLIMFGESSILNWIGVNSDPDAIEIAKNIVLIPYHIFISMPENSEIWLDNAPLMSIFNIAMFFVGSFYYLKNFKAGRTKQLLAFFVLALVLIGLGGPVSFSTVLPLLFLIIAMGINYTLKIWFTKFPLNPLAKWLANGLIVIAVAISCLYGIRAYFVAWPHNATTKSVFNIKV